MLCYEICMLFTEAKFRYVMLRYVYENFGNTLHPLSIEEDVKYLIRSEFAGGWISESGLQRTDRINNSFAVEQKRKETSVPSIDSYNRREKKREFHLHSEFSEDKFRISRDQIFVEKMSDDRGMEK